MTVHLTFSTFKSVENSTEDSASEVDEAVAEALLENYIGSAFLAEVEDLGDLWSVKVTPHGPQKEEYVTNTYEETTAVFVAVKSVAKKLLASLFPRTTVFVKGAK